jgi:hypothetical protein
LFIAFLLNLLFISLHSLPSKPTLPAPRKKVFLKMIRPAPWRSLNSLLDKVACLVAQVFNLCEGFSHSLERLCHQAEKLMGKDKPIGGEGKMWNRFNALWSLNPATSPTPSPPASGGLGDRMRACNFLTGHCCLNPPFSKGDFTINSL